MKRALWAPLLAAPLLALLAFGFARNPDAASSPLLHHQASAIHLRTLDNAPFSLASLRGKPVVLNFWASWCLGCKIEHPYLVQAWHAYRREGVAFDYGVYGVPETFFIDRRGVIRDKSTGPVTPELLSRDIQQLLQSKP